MNHLPFLDSVLREAAARLPGSPGASTTKPGEPSQVVTAADHEIEELLTARISAAYPGYGILGEETGLHGENADAVWVLDPIDGTSNYAAGSPLFGIMAGLLVGGVPVAGGIALPALGEFYLAQRGEGAFRNGARFRAPTATGLGTALIAYGIDGDSEFAQEDFTIAAALATRCRGLRMANSCFDLVQVATGAYGASLNRATRIWDSVAPHVLLEEAGITYTDFAGAPIRYTPLTRAVDTNFTVCAAAPGLHAQLQHVIH
ncbi:myo-inositol-1(or 4)-monophosphatase [Amycolatopsis xylanica]|uniref:Myo-inositol-1(Or 4)-monophosphatase n=1 Tax=Amycolatopsis xylanica TaxID=589385 RepID=A0A1H3S931_9PSEU|nr:inositol monophosphatase [Amycolatopsis xylanica]SDZ34180.1 myo-inositol-1(or 4)-monophosphatase [Amycolatopsis xylanica]